MGNNKRKKKDNKIIINTKLSINDWIIFYRVLTRRYVIGTLIFCILYLIDHPNSAVIRLLHDILLKIALP